jgi:hypothetical protein
MTPTGNDGVVRLVEQYDTLTELEVAVLVRELDGWLVLSAGEVRAGRWWAEYERPGPPAPDAA